jgi:hypothetical protein
MTESYPDRHYWPDEDAVQSVIFQFIVTADTDSGVTVYTEPGDDGYFLTWTDFVANSWREHYDTLSAVFVRLAVLQRCGEKDWNLGFTAETPDEFATAADTFLTAHVA